MRWFSPAKINLFFRVLAKRPDGFHEVASLYQAISLGDFLLMEFAPSDSLEYEKKASFVEPPGGFPLDDRNLIWKAIQLFRAKTGFDKKLRCHLTKQIPCCAGLGGGSSNAATALYALNVLSGSHILDEELALWAAEIGSDVAFFFSNGTAMCTGRGEKVKNLPPLPPQSLTVIASQHGLATPEIFSRLDLSKTSIASPQELFERFVEGHLHEKDSSLFVNDLETPAFSLREDLKKRKAQISQKAPCFMTGSGSALVAMGEKLLAPLPGETLFQAKFLNRTPNCWYDLASSDNRS